MAISVAVQLSCPLCSHDFEARDMGQSYYISGIDTDLRETGSVEQVRRFSVSTCPECGFGDFTWDFFAPYEFEDTEQQRLLADLAQIPKQVNEFPTELKPFVATQKCFALRGMDPGSRAELSLLTYYVARDMSFQRESELRTQAAELFSQAFTTEEGHSALSVRYAYLAGELRRLGGDPQAAIEFFDHAIAHGEQLQSEGIEFHGELDLLSMARRQRAEVVHGKDSSQALVAVCKVESRDVRTEVSRILASRRDSTSLQLLPEVFEQLESRDRVVMLREFSKSPHLKLLPMLHQALKSKNAESLRLAAKALGQLKQLSSFEHLYNALDRGVLTTETALMDAIRRLNHPESAQRIRDLLARWESQGDRHQWATVNDPAPLRNYLYLCGDEAGMERLAQDMEALEENDLWDKVPFGSPIPAAIRLGSKVRPVLAKLLLSKNAVTRRWAAHIVYELEDHASLEMVQPLINDADPIVRLQTAKTLARLGDQGHSQLVLNQLREFDKGELPFALHFLVEFCNDEVRGFLLHLLEEDLVTLGEILPLLGRQEPNKRIDGIIEESLHSHDEDSRAGAVTALAFQGRKSTVKRLQEFLSSESSETVKRRLIFGLARLGEMNELCKEDCEGILIFLRGCFESCEPRLRFPIAMALLHLNDDSGIAIVRDRAAAIDESFDHYDLVAPAIKALARFEKHRH
jgi:HEAT repeat protein